MKRAEMSLALLAALNIALAFVSQIVVFAVIGPGGDTDALIASATLPTIFNTVIAVALPAVLVPRLAAEAETWQVEVAAAAGVALTAVAAAVALAIFATSDAWVRLLFGGFSPAQAALCADLQRVQVASMPFTAAATVATTLLAARGRFIAVEALTLAAVALMVFGLYALLPRFGIEAAAWLALARAALLAALLLPLVDWKAHVRPAWAELGTLWRRLRPLVAGNLYYKTEVVVDRFLLSMGNAGELSLYGVAQQVHSAASSVAGKVWGNVAVPQLSAHAKQQDRASFVRLFLRNLTILVALPAAGCVLFVLAGQPLLQLAIGHGRIGPDDVALLWWLMVLLSGVVIGGSAGALLVGAFYALGDTRTPTYMSIVTFSLFLGVKYLAFTRYGVEGLCWATTAYYMLNAMLLAALLPRVLHRRLPR